MSAFVSRLLPSHEWHRLAGTEAETIHGALDPRTARVMVVEQDGAIVGCWLLMPLYHAECLWIAAGHRGKASVARRLWGLMRSTARQLGLRTVLTAAVTDDVRGLLTHVGATRLPGDHYVMPMKENE